MEQRPQDTSSHQRPQERQSPQLQQRLMRRELYVRDSSFESRSSEHDEEEEDCEEITFLEACMECDDDALHEIIRDGVTREQVNERDKSGRTGLSHACANGFIPILELLLSLEELDPNLADNDGNTPLIYAAQAGHDDVVSYLLQNMRQVRVDQCNRLGFTALMKAAIQGRTRCAKLLLFAGASPNRRDHGRGLCSEEWARFCGCHSCANSVAKYVRSKKYFFKKTFLLSKDKWSSEPDILSSDKRGTSGGGEKAASWIQRHLSLKRKKPRGAPALQSRSTTNVESLNSSNKFGSAPILLINSYEEEADSATKTFRRPSCFDNVVPVSIGRHRHDHEDDYDEVSDNPPPPSTSTAASTPTTAAAKRSSTSDDQSTLTSSRVKQQRPPKITVGDPTEKSASVAGVVSTARTTAGAIVASSLSVLLPGKAVAVSDGMRHRAASSGSGCGRSCSSRRSSSPSPPPPSPALPLHNH